MIQIAGSQLNQWDVGRSVRVSDSKATHVHFANQGDFKAPIIKIENGEAVIPDYLLQTGKPLLAYAVLDGVTLECKSFAVRKRERPENYVYEDDRRNYIYELITMAEDAVENANQAAQKANEAAEKLGSAVIPTKVSQLENDSGFLTEAPVTSVNGQTGDVTLPTPVKVSVTQQPDGSYTADLRTAQIVAAYQAGSAVYCCFGQLVLALSYAALARCIFTCIYNGRLHIISVESSGTTVSDTALGSGGGSDGMTPYIGDNGNWFIGDTDTGVRAEGKDGKDAPQEAILYTPQTLTPEQQAQARENVGAVEAPETAEVGQTIVVKEVDENGKPTAWEATDIHTGGGGEWELLHDVTTEEVVSVISAEVDGAYRELYISIITALDENVNKYLDLQINGSRIAEGSVNRNAERTNIMYVRIIPEFNVVHCLSSFANGGSAKNASVSQSLRDTINYTDTITLSTATYGGSNSTTGNIFTIGSKMKVWGRK